MITPIFLVFCCANTIDRAKGSLLWGNNEFSMQLDEESAMKFHEKSFFSQAEPSLTESRVVHSDMDGQLY